MTYEPTTPTGPGEDPSVSQPKITTNFEDISLLVNVNHVDFNGANQGKHKFVTLPEQGTAPVILENEGAVYTKEFIATQITQLFWRNEKKGIVDGTEQQMTNVLPDTTGTNSEWNFSDGFQIRFGTAQHTTKQQPVTFKNSFDNNTFIVLLTPIGSAGQVKSWNVSNISLDGFTIGSDGAEPGSPSFQYFAIGN